MIGLVIVTHNQIGAELLKAVNGIVGPQQQAEAITVGMGDDMGDSRDHILSAIKTANSGDGVIIMVDMFGGTPSNLAIGVMPISNAVVLAGVNMPMLVKFASVRASLPLLEAAREAEMAGRKYVQLISENLAQGQGA